MSGWSVSKETGGWVACENRDDVPDGFIWSETQPKQCADGVEDIKRKRRLAYAHPVNGSDLHLSEAISERAAGNENVACLAEAACLARKEEIRKELPWPN